MKSEKRTTVYFEASSADRLCELLGAYDENLKTLSAELGVGISVADGLTLKISGEKENVVLCEKALKAAAGAAEKGERIDERQILYCIETAKSGESEETEKLFDGVVATTATGKKIKCKTLGQKRYAEAIDKNSVVFGIGPAGTGKTYLAVAKAVAAFKAKKAEKIILTRPAVEAAVIEGFKEFANTRGAKKTFEEIIKKAQGAAKVRLAAKQAKDNARAKNSIDGLTLIGKLASCSGRKPELNEMFIVEGDSHRLKLVWLRILSSAA